MNLVGQASASAGSDQTAWQEAVSSYSAGMFQNAHRALHRYLSQHADCGRGWELLGLVYHQWRMWPQATAALEEASFRVPASSIAVCALGDCYLATGRHAWAESYYREVLQQEHPATVALLGAAAGLDQLSRPQLASSACRRAIALEPDTAQPYYDLSYYLRRSGAPVSQVVATARRAIDLAPNNMTFRIGLAGFLHSQGRAAEGAGYLADLSPEHVQLIYCGRCLGRLIGVFEAVDDKERVSWCRTRQALLRATGDDVPC